MSPSKKAGGSAAKRSRPQPGAPDAMRGVIIVVIAALLGLFLLARGGSSTLLADSGGGTAAPSGPTTTAAGLPPIDKPTTTPSPPATNPPASVVVAIFNGTGGKDTSAAGRNRDKLTPLGYTQISISDTSATAASAVYYADGAHGDAAAIAQALGFTDATVAPLGEAESLPTSSQGAAVIVIVGQDQPAPG